MTNGAVSLCQCNKWEWSLLVYLSSVLLPLIHFVQQVAFVEILTFFVWRRNILNSYSTLSQFTFYREFHLRCICHFWRDSAKFVHPGKETFISLAHIPLNQKHNHFALFVFDIWSKLIKKFVEIIHKGHPQEYLPQCFCAFSHDMLGTEFKNLFKSNPVNLLFKVLGWDAFLPLLNQ